MVCVYTNACIRAHKLFLTSFSSRNPAFFAFRQFQKYLHVCMHGHGMHSALIGAGGTSACTRVPTPPPEQFPNSYSNFKSQRTDTQQARLIDWNEYRTFLLDCKQKSAAAAGIEVLVCGLLQNQLRLSLVHPLASFEMDEDYKLTFCPLLLSCRVTKGGQGCPRSRGFTLWICFIWRRALRGDRMTPSAEDAITRWPKSH